MVGGKVGAERHCGHPSEDLMPVRRESAGKAGELHRAGGCILTGFVEPELCPSRGHSDHHSETGLGPGTLCDNAAVLAAGHTFPRATKHYKKLYRLKITGPQRYKDTKKP